MKSQTAAFILGGLALLAGLLGACSDSDGSSEEAAQPASEQLAQQQARPQVMATTDIWANVVAASTCGHVVVDSVIPSGADPHHYEPVPQDVLALEEADLVVVNGFNLEESLLDNLGGISQVFTVADFASVEEEHGDHDDDHDDEDDHSDYDDDDDHDDEDDHSDYDDDDDHDDDEDHDEDSHDDHSDDDEDHDDEDHADEHTHDHGGTDPHLWFDFQIVEETVEHINEKLTPLVDDPQALHQCADSYLSQLEDTEDYVSQQLLSVPASDRILVTQHQTLRRLADQFGYEILGSVIPSTSTLADADVRNLIELQQDIEDAGVKAIFVDVSGDNSDVRNFAEQSGVPVVQLYTESLSEPGGEADSYLKLMRLNAERIAAALG